MKKLTINALFFAGAGVVCYGLFAAWKPLGIVAIGLMLLAYSVALFLEMSQKDRANDS